jgi:uncharacterized membrane protein YfcA
MSFWQFVLLMAISVIGAKLGVKLFRKIYPRKDRQ